MDIETWEEFWDVYQHIQRPSKLPPNCELFFFKKGIRPIWEENENRGGGKFIIRVKKEFADLVWEKLLISLFKDNDPLLVGIVVISKANESMISLWTRELEFYGDKQVLK